MSPRGAPSAPRTPTTRRPSPAALAAAVADGRTVPDVLRPRLDVVFCGINPGRWSGAVGRHFAHPGNRFWKALQRSGFTDDVLAPATQELLLAAGLGITNVVGRTTASAADLTPAELRAGAEQLERKVRALRPRAVCFLGLGAYRTALRRPRAVLGRQPDPFGGAMAWVTANPSGLQARYGLDELAAQLRELRSELGTVRARPSGEERRRR